jgi:hypothetical protein
MLLDHNLRRGGQVCTILLSITLTLVGCSEKNEKVTRPNSVPSSAVWIGAADGGNYYDCQSIGQDQLACTVYNEDGSVWVSHNFIPEPPSVSPADIAGFDGEYLTMKRSLRYVPAPSQQVPKIAQDCSHFTLSAKPSSIGVGPKDDVSFAVTLINNSAEVVTVAVQEMPNHWAIYRKVALSWKRLASGGVSRGQVLANLPEISADKVPDRFPAEVYRKLSPGERLTTHYNFTEQLWNSADAAKPRASRLKLILSYRYQAPESEKSLNMLQCSLAAPPIEIRMIRTK